MCGGFLDDAFDFVGGAFEGIGNTVSGALSGDFGNIMSLASLIPGPQQPFLMGANAIRHVTEDNPLGAALSAYGAGSTGGLFDAAGGITAAGGSAAVPGSTDLVGNLDGLSGDWGSVGMGGGSDVLGDFISDLPSGRLTGSGVESTNTGFSNNLGNFADSVGASGLYDTLAYGGSLPNAVSNIRSDPLMQFGGGLAKLYGGYEDYRSAQKARRAFSDNVDSIRNLYSLDSPYAKQARKAITRRDAARGRNSQYGSRETELAAMLADRQAQTLNSPGYLAQLGASNQNSAGLGGLLSGGLSAFNGLRGLF